MTMELNAELHLHPILLGTMLQESSLARFGSRIQRAHFFLPPAPPSSLRSQEITLPSMTTPFPSMKATRDRPSQFLNVSHTSGCCGWNEHSAISLDLSEW